MAKVIYLPEKGSEDETEQFGHKFAGGKPTEVTDEKALAKFRGNPFFKVSEAKEKADKAPESGLKAVHVSGGRFVIKKDGETIKEGLNKADADAFNAMSDEDKAEIIK
ncbi:hypothetical protein [Sinorhizobium meliloti]|uniref:hypothetical protein n=1 Tax=Rhizobium meliloti TaxID=382 RepID=UPI000D1F27E9|nr:hypothetical protein [Sinorhizobium meliloti]RMI21364.1 hypothetical protein DA102_002100 [Sinorhizobium meliloti]